MTNHVIIDHVLINGTGLIMHGPASVDHLKLARFYQSSDLVLRLIRLLLPPHTKELHLNLDKASLRILQEGLHDGINGLTDTRRLYVLRCTVEILVHRLQPADVIMRMRNNVHSLDGVDRAVCWSKGSDQECRSQQDCCPLIYHLEHMI